MAYFNDIQTTIKDSANLDAFSRLRVSQITTQADYKLTFDNLPNLIDQVQSGASSTWNSGESSITLATNNTGQYAIAQTKQRFLYQSGKSQLTFKTFYDFTPETNITKRIGYFSSSNVAPYTANLDGIYLESDNGVVTAKIDRLGTNVHSADQSSWNIDRLNPALGLNPSGITVDWSQNQIFVIDFQYLGVGRIRLGLDIDGKVIYFHEFLNANRNKKVYMAYSNQPIRWEIRQTGAGSGSFTFICSSVNSEGSINTVGFPGHIDTTTTAIAGNTIGTTYALLGIRLKSTHLSSIVEVVRASILANTADQYYVDLRFNPTVAGTFTYSDVTNYAIQRAIGTATNTVTGGLILTGDPAQNTATSNLNLGGALRIGSKIDGTPDALVLCVTPISATINFFATMNWLEF